MSDRLDKAIADFEDETLDLTLGERISGLRQALIWNAYHAIKSINAKGKKSPISEEEDYRQTQCMKWFKELEKLYTAQLRINKISGKTDDAMDKDFLKKIKELKSSIGDIVRDIQPIGTNGTK